MQENGVVMAVNGKRAQIRLDQGEKCQGCTACKSFGDGTMRLIADNPLGARVGDSVIVSVQPQQVIGHSFLLFIFPILAMIIGYVIGQKLYASSATSEGPGIIGSLVGLLLSIGLLKWIDLKRSNAPLAAQITAIQTAPHTRLDSVNTESDTQPVC